MTINSLTFMWFFPLVLALWYLTPARYRAWVLALASVAFYLSWGIAFVSVPLFCALCAWGGGLYLRSGRSAMSIRTVLVLTIAATLAVLLVFKYFGFVTTTLAQTRLISQSAVARLALPAGISFFTFRTVSYLVDVRKKKVDPQRSFVAVAAYILYFPQLLAGPIERAGAFLPQLATSSRPDSRAMRDGLALILWGVFKKMVIADNLATVVNWVYVAPQEYPGLPLLVATYCYAFQIYCDFSGYTDMALGCGRMMGVAGARNFDRPYAAVSITDFWRRWHITLSSWFRDYLYIPLGGSRVHVLRWSINILIVFLISGLWHGANWTFILWGALHGFYLLLERFVIDPLLKRLPLAKTGWAAWVVHAARVLFTFHLVLFSWIFFRASSITDGLYIAKNLFNGLDLSGLNLFAPGDLNLATLLILLLLAAEYIRRNGSAHQWLLKRPRWVRWAVYAGLVLMIVNVQPQFASGFIYLQF